MNGEIQQENMTGAPESSKKSSWKSLLKEILIFAIIAFGIVMPFRIYIAEPYLVDGRSMYPTFDTNEYLIVDKLSYRIGEPKRNDVVVFKYPNNPEKNFIKRIIGLPGDTLIIKDNVIQIINEENPEGFILDQSFVVYESPSQTQITLAPQNYFVMGDNRSESFDSRSWGTLDRSLILGRPIARLLPFSKIDLMPGKVTE